MKNLNRRITLGAGLLGISAAFAIATPSFAAPHDNDQDIRRDHREIREDRREVHEDRKDVQNADTPADRRHQRHELHEDQRDLHQDNHDLRHDRREDQREDSWRKDNHPVWHNPGNTAPRPGYDPQHPVYNGSGYGYGYTPRPGYNNPRPVYNAPRPVYNNPGYGYNNPRPVYNGPRPGYGGYGGTRPGYGGYGGNGGYNQSSSIQFEGRVSSPPENGVIRVKADNGQFYTVRSYANVGDNRRVSVRGNVVNGVVENARVSAL